MAYINGKDFYPDMKNFNILYIIDIKKLKLAASSALAKADKDIRLKIVSRGLTFDFCYVVGKGEWKLLKNNVDAGFLSTRNAGGSTGTTIGLYATRG